MVSDEDIDISGNINEADCYLPSQLASEVLQFFSARYSSVNETEEYENQRKRLIRNY